MTDIIDKYLGEKNSTKALESCNQDNKYLQLLLSKLFDTKLDLSITEDKEIKVKLLCNWCTSEQLSFNWNKMSKGNFKWNNIRLVWNEDPDYYVIINSPPKNEKFDKEKTIVFQMEPRMKENASSWGEEWANPDSKDFFKVFKHEDRNYNNIEWHISLTYNQLSNFEIIKDSKYDKVLSVVLSSKYGDVGHMKRIDFVKFLESKNFPVHVYGDNKWDYKDYKGHLPYHNKDQGILPYKYIFNAENNEVYFYLTEKLIDGILGECLTFYWGCPNVRDIIDPNAYVQLDLSNLESNYEIIKKAIDEDWYSQRLPYIRKEKERILNELQFFPRLEKILQN